MGAGDSEIGVTPTVGSCESSGQCPSSKIRASPPQPAAGTGDNILASALILELEPSNCLLQGQGKLFQLWHQFSEWGLESRQAAWGRGKQFADWSSMYLCATAH